MKGMHQNTPDDNDRAELAGRRYEATDIAMAIEAGRYESLQELADELNASADKMDRTHHCRVWWYTPNCCLDLDTTLQHATQKYST